MPDSVENQEDFLRKTRKGVFVCGFSRCWLSLWMLTDCYGSADAFRALPCTQTTESSRLLRNASLETPRRGETTAGTTGANLFATSDHSTPSGRRPTRRIRSLPTPYSASGSTTNSSRRSTLDGSSSRSVGSTSTPTGHPPVQSTESLASASPSDRLGQLMSQLGERFSHRNEARKRRAEMQEKVNLQNQQLEAARVERARRDAEERRRIHLDHGPSTVGSAVQGRPQSTVVPKQAVPQRNFQSTEHDAKRRAVEAHPQALQVRPRHPLAQSDVNQRPNQVNLPPKTVPAGRPPQNQQPQIIPGPIKANNIFAKVANQVHQESVQPPRPQARPGYQAHTSAVPSSTRPTINQPAPKPAAAPPAVVAEPDNEPGNHQNSDTSFESMTDMEGLFNEGGEEVEALLKACDGF